MSALDKLISGVGWGSLSTISNIFAQIFFMAAMARLLTPADFGVIAIANVSLRFISYFAQLGISPAIIQKSDLDDQDVAAALTVSLVISMFFWIVSIAISPWVSLFYQMPELAPVIWALSCNFLIGGVSSVCMGLLRRNTKFRSLAVIDTIAYIFGYGITGLVLAIYGAGVWSLVGAACAQYAITMFLSLSVTWNSLRFAHNPVRRKHFLNFGGRYSVIGFLEFLAFNLDSMLIGKLFGQTAAGIYSRAYLLANLPVQQPATVISRALLPIMSAMGEKSQKQSNAFELGLLAIGSYAFAVGAGVYVAAPDLVEVLLGKNWLTAIPATQVLACSVGPLFVTHVCGVTLDSMAELNVKLKVQFSFLITLIFLFAAFQSNDFIGIALAVVINETLRMVVLCKILGGLLNITLTNWVIIVMTLLLSALISWLFIQCVYSYWPISLPIQAKLVVEMLTGGIALMATFLLMRRILLRLPSYILLASKFHVLNLYVK